MLHPEIDDAFELANEEMNHAIDHLQKELQKIRTGKASGSILEGIRVDYYGAPTPLHQVANVSVSDARTIVIQPWEKKILAAIERSLFEANLGITPQNDGEIIRLTIPPLTEERRRDLVKQAKHMAEDTKVSMRNTRREVMEIIKKATKDGYPEDMGKRKEQEIQDIITSFSTKVDKLLEAKEKDILTL